MTDKPVEVYESKSNIFADLDLGLSDAETHGLMAQFVAKLYRITTECKLTQPKAGALMVLSQPEVSRLFKGNFREYSVDRLRPCSTKMSRLFPVCGRIKERTGNVGNSLSGRLRLR
jgi:predicted XRE-type DNA-binding protein